MNAILKTALAVAGVAIATQAVADVIFYENENFQGQEHRLQMTSPPGSTITVNGKGEPRA